VGELPACGDQREKRLFSPSFCAKRSGGAESSGFD